MMEKILVVDDEESVRIFFGRLLERNDYQCTLAANAAEARACLNEDDFALILSDLNMPGESGLEFLQYSLATYPDTGAIMVTVTDDLEVAKTALEMGIYGYVVKPPEPRDIIINVANALYRRQLEIKNRACLKNLELIVLKRTADLEDRQKELKHSLRNLRRTLDGAIQAMALTVEQRDPYTAGHQRRVADLASAIATEMGLSKESIEGIRMAGIIHDIGKIAIPVEILAKPGGITKTELELIKVHPQAGYDILKPIEFPWPIGRIVFQHHERMNGSGYPSGIKGEKILIEARVLAVADVIEAMCSHRPYRPALGVDKALDEISRNRATLYDPQVVDASLTLFRGKGVCYITDRLLTVPI